MGRMVSGQRGDSPSVREIPPGSTQSARSALLELRPHVDAGDFRRLVDEVQRPQGYRLAGVFVTGSDDAVAVAGFRVMDNLVSGRFLYVDDLVTATAHRRRGHGRRLMSWLIEEATRLGCAQLELDSATHRHAAHRLYLVAGLDITAFHFGLNLSREDAD